MKKEEGFKEQLSVILPEYIIRELRNDPICKQLYATDIGFYPNAEGHHRVRKEGCGQYILIYCIKGKGWISEGGRRIAVKANQYFVIPPEVPHSYASDDIDPWSIYWVHFAGKLAAFFYDTLGSPKTISPSNLDRIEDRIQFFYEIIRNLEMGYALENLQYSNVCLLHLLSSFKYISQFRQIQKMTNEDVVAASISYMKQNLDKKQALENLAAESRLSVSQYSLLFRKKTGRSPMDYFTNLKIQRACQLLDNSTLRIGEIAARVGYGDPFHFSRIFKQLMGMSPKNYRQTPKG